MRIGILMLALGLVLGLAASANAEIYRWTDADGKLHFTQNLEQVPKDKRPAARTRAKAPPSDAVQTYSGSMGTSTAAKPRKRTRRRHGEGLRIKFQRDGSLMRVNVKLNDYVTAPFLIDTGASGISLPSHVAEKLGFRVKPDTRHVQVMTAAGIVSRAVMKLDAVELDGARVENLDATVNPAMEIGLLGGTFFNNFVYRVDAAASYIELSPNENIRGGMGEAEWRRRFRGLLDPIAKLKHHLDTADIDDDGERAYLENRALEMRAALDVLELEANRVDVPYTWRR